MADMEQSKAWYTSDECIVDDTPPDKTDCIDAHFHMVVRTGDDSTRASRKDA